MAVLSWGALVPLLLLGRAGFHPHSLGGLYEKIFLGMELLWLALVAVCVAQGSGEAFGVTARGPNASVTRAAAMPSVSVNNRSNLSCVRRALLKPPIGQASAEREFS